MINLASRSHGETSAETVFLTDLSKHSTYCFMGSVASLGVEEAIFVVLFGV